MPPSGDRGPVIGSGFKRMISDAAIKADMEHRGFSDAGGGTFALRDSATETTVFNTETTVWVVTVSDGSVDVQVIRGDRYSRDVPWESEYSDIQKDVFDYWPGAIDDAFRGYEDMSSPFGLDNDAWSVESGASEIQAGGDTQSGTTAPGNPRLGADLTNVYSKASDLSGNYAERFTEDYLAPLPGVLSNLTAMTRTLAFALGAESGIFTKARDDIATIAVDGLSAMEASGPGGGDATGLKILLGIFGAAAAGVATVATGGTALATAAGLTAAGAGGAGALLNNLVKPPATPEKIPLGAGNPHDVLKNIKDALTQLNDQFKAEETKVDGLLTAGHDALVVTTGNHFDISRPGIDDHTHDVLDRKQTIKVDAESIAKITELYIPTINGDIKQCAGDLVASAGSWARPASLGIAADGAWSSCSALQTALQDRLLDLVTEMSGAADNLQTAARMIGQADDEVNAAFAAKAKRINDEDIDTV